MGWFSKRQRAPLYASIQTRNAVPVGALSFAFATPYFTPTMILGAGVPCGSYRQEGYNAAQQVAMAATNGLGGLVIGTLAQQPLSPADYVLSRPIA